MTVAEPSYSFLKPLHFSQISTIYTRCAFYIILTFKLLIFRLKYSLLINCTTIKAVILDNNLVLKPLKVLA